jgi:tetratricopeptide (TPR) repeat protein
MKQKLSNHENLIKRGLCFHESFRYAKALPLFRKAFRLAPECPSAIYNLANTLHMLAREKEAQILLSKLIQKSSAELATGCASLRQPNSFRSDALYLMFHVMLYSTRSWSKAFPFAQRHLRNRKRGLKSAWSVRTIRREIAELRATFSPA